MDDPIVITERDEKSEDRGRHARRRKTHRKTDSGSVACDKSKVKKEVRETKRRGKSKGKYVLVDTDSEHEEEGTQFESEYKLSRPGKAKLADCQDEDGIPMGIPIKQSVSEEPLPYKFTFMIDEIKQVEKSEYEKEMDELWEEHDIALGLLKSST